VAKHLSPEGTKAICLTVLMFEPKRHKTYRWQGSNYSYAWIVTQNIVL